MTEGDAKRSSLGKRFEKMVTPYIPKRNTDVLKTSHKTAQSLAQQEFISV